MLNIAERDISAYWRRSRLGYVVVVNFEVFCYSERMIKIMSIMESTKEFPNIVEKMRSGDYIILQKNGRPVAGIVDADDMEDFVELKNPLIKKQINRGYREFKAGKTMLARLFLQSLKRVGK